MNSERQLQISQGLKEYIEGRGADRFADSHISAEPDLRDVALEYLSLWEGNLEFMNDLKKKGDNLSIGQIRGILNVALAQVRERPPRIPSSPVNGIALRGYYLMPNNGPTIVIRRWQEDGTSIIGYEDPISKRVEAFGSIAPGGAEYMIWGRYRSNEQIKLIADDFLTIASGKERGEMAQAYRDLTGKCANCGEQEAATDGRLCNACAEKLYGEEPGW